MKLEKLMSINNVIEAQDKHERELKLREKIETISLYYALERYKEKKEENPEYKLSEALKDYSNTKTFVLTDLYFSDVDGNECFSKADKYVEDLYEEVDKVYSPETDNVDEVLSFIKQKAEGLKSFLGIEDVVKKSYKRDDQVTNLLYYNTVDEVGKDLNARYKDLEKEGFSELDKCLEIHVGEFYFSDNQSLGGELVRKDLEALAIYIIDKKPEIKAVVGKSWLMNTPIADKLGFKKFGEDVNLVNEYANWIQFIDKNGDISKKRFDALLKTGELPYKVAKAYIPVEDFLKKYLPENRRGQVTLKKLNEAKVEKWKKIGDGTEKAKKLWDEMINQNYQFEEFLDKAETMRDLISLLKPEAREVYLNHLKNMFVKRTPWKEVRLHESEEIEKMGKEIDQIRENELYKDIQIEV